MYHTTPIVEKGEKKNSRIRSLNPFLPTNFWQDNALKYLCLMFMYGENVIP